MPASVSVVNPDRDPYPLSVWSRVILAGLAVECATMAASLWLRPPLPLGRTDVTIATLIPVLGTLWPWLFAIGAVLLTASAVTGWNRWLHVVLSLGFGVHASYGLGALAVSMLNDTGWVVASQSGALALFYLASALRLARGHR